MSIVKKLEDGRMFPIYKEETLSWTLDTTHKDEKEGNPRLRVVIQAMLEYRPEQLERERRQLVRDSFGRMFGHNAKRILAVVEDELSKNIGA